MDFKRLATCALALVLAATPAFAQHYQDTSGTAVPGSVPISPGVGPWFTPSNPANVTGSFTATLSGFKPTPAYTTLAVGVTSQRTALPSGTVVIVYNVGANDASVTLGTTAVTATGANDIIKAGQAVPFTVGTFVDIAAIEATGAGGTSSLVISGGSGLPTGWGAGGSAGSSALPTGASTSALQTALNAYAASIVANTASLNGIGTGGTGTGLTVTCTNCTSGGSSGGNTPQTTAGGDINVSTAATIKLITGVAGEYTYITAYNFISAGTTNVSLEYGTTTTNPCDTNTTVFDGPSSLTATAGKAQGNGLGSVFLPIPQGKDVCIVNSAAIQVGGSLNYTQSSTLVGSFGGGGGGGSSSPFVSNGNYVNVPSVTGSSFNSALPAGGGTSILMSNYGSSAIMVQLSTSGSSAVTAATADDVIPANSTHSIGVGTNTNIAYSTITGTSSLQITGGTGTFMGAGGGGGGTSGSSNPDQRLTAIGTISAADTLASITTGANGQSVITWSALPTTNSHAEFAGFSGVQTGLLICAGTFSGTFEFDVMMDNASPSKYIKQTIELTGGSSPDKISSFTGPVMGRVGLDGAIGGRIRATSAPTGSPTCTLNVTSNLHEVHVLNLLPAGITNDINLSTSTTGTALINGVSGQSIKVSAWDAIAAGTTNLSLGWSASTSCTSITKLAGPYPLTAQTGIARGDGTSSLITVPSGDTLCIISDGSGVAVGGSAQTTQY